MRNGNSHISVDALSAQSPWRSSWIGRLILVALLIAASALALMPDRTSAHHTADTTYETHCQSLPDGDMTQEIVNSDIVSDCIALLKAAEQLTVGDDTTINWLTPTDQFLPVLAPRSMGASSWDGVGIEEVGEAPNQVYRITSVSLSMQDLSGELAPEWAELTALTSLDLSNNDLSGTVPRDAWTLFDGLETLSLDGNKDLLPSPPLNLTADLNPIRTGEDSGKSAISVSFDNIWYALDVRKHEYRYNIDGGQWVTSDTSDSDGWRLVDTGCTDADAPALCPKTHVGDETRVVETLDELILNRADAYVFQVRAVKETPYVDDKGTPDDTSDDTNEVTTRSKVSQINLVGLQTLTEGFEFVLELDTGISYTAARETQDDILEVAPAAGGLRFTPNETAESVGLTLIQTPSDVTDSEGVVIGQAGGAHKITLEIKPASSAPTNVDIPSRSILRDGQPTSVNLARHFRGEGLTYTATSSRPNFATVEIDQETQELVITTLRAGVTVITVTATNPDRGWASDTFRLTVVSPNNPPEVAGSVPDQTLFLDDAGTQLYMTSYFRDEDGDILRFMPQSSNPRVVTASSSGNAITFNVIDLGEVSMTVLAEDPEGATAFVTFTVTVLPPNNAPEAVGEIPAQTLRVGEPALALNLAPYFTDADGDLLTFTAGTADGSILTVDIAGSVVTMTGVAAGETTMTVTATDTSGESAMQEVAVTALPANRPPEAVGSIGRQLLVEGGSPVNIDVAEYFTDPDGDELTYTAASSNNGAVRAEIADESSTLALTPLVPVEGVTVTVVAMDGDGEWAAQIFMVTVAAASRPSIPTPTVLPGPEATPTPTQMPAPTSSPESPASPEPTSGPEATATPPPDEGGGFPVGLFFVFLLLVAGAGAAVFIIRRRSMSPPAEPG